MEAFKRNVFKYFVKNILSEEELVKNAKSLYIKRIGDKDALYKYNEKEKYSVGSLVKLMTSIVVLDSNISLDRKVRVSEEAEWFTQSERMFRNVSLKEGDKVKVRDLLVQSMSVSACDSSWVLSEVFGKDIKFTDRMEKRAKDIGMTNFTFKDPVGYMEGNKISSEDIYLMAEYFIDTHREIFFSLLRDSVKVKGSNYKSTSPIFKHSDTLVVKSIKTGFLDEAGRSIILYIKDKVSREEYIIIVVGANRMIYRDVLIEKAFTNYIAEDIHKKRKNFKNKNHKKINEDLKLEIKV